jgi:hypothetical protein
MAEEVVNMRPKYGKCSPMAGAAQITDLARSSAAALVEREQRAAGSRMVAYERVSAMVGASSAWLRKFIGRSPDVRPDLVVGLNILSLHAGFDISKLYGQLCERVEQEHQNERARNDALRAEIHEAIEGALEMVVRARRGSSPQEAAREVED